MDTRIHGSTDALYIFNLHILIHTLYLSPESVFTFIGAGSPEPPLPTRTIRTVASAALFEKDQIAPELYRRSESQGHVLRG